MLLQSRVAPLAVQYVQGRETPRTGSVPRTGSAPAQPLATVPTGLVVPPLWSDQKMPPTTWPSPRLKSSTPTRAPTPHPTPSPRVQRTPRLPNPDDVNATVGIMVWPGQKGELIVTELMKDTSAYGCGLMKGDVLIAVDGESIGDMPAADASHLLSGKLNSKVAVQVQRGEGAKAARKTASLIRDVPLDSVTTADAEIGVQLSSGPNATLVIVGLMEKTSAASCGIKIGDVITHIDDARVGQGTPTSRFVGPAGSKVKMTLSRMHHGVPVNLELIRDVEIEHKKGTPRKRLGTTELDVLREAEELAQNEAEEEQIKWQEVIEKEAKETKTAAAAARKLIMEKEAAATKAEEDRKREEEERKFKRNAFESPSGKVVQGGFLSPSPHARHARNGDLQDKRQDTQGKFEDVEVPSKLCDAKTAEIASLRRELEEANLRCGLASQRIRGLIPERDQLATENQALKAEAQALKADLKSKDAEILALQSAPTTWKNEVSAVSTALEAKIQKLQETLLGKDAEIEALNKTLKEMKAGAAAEATEPNMQSAPHATKASQSSSIIPPAAHDSPDGAKSSEDSSANLSSPARRRVMAPRAVEEYDLKAEEALRQKENNNDGQSLTAAVRSAAATPSAWPQYNGSAAGSSCGRSTRSSIWASNTKVGIGAYFQKSEAHPDAFEVKKIEANGPLDACKLVSVGDHIIAVDGQPVHGKSLTQLAMTVMGTPDSSIECSFRKKDTRELITVSLVRHTKGGAGSQAQTSEKISQAEMNHPMALCNQKSAAADPIDSNQLVRQSTSIEKDHLSVASSYVRGAHSSGRSTCSSVWASNTRVGIGAYFKKSEELPDAFELKRIESNGPLDLCKLVSVGDQIVAIDGESVSGKSLSQLAQTVMGVPNTMVECSFKRRETQDLITVSLVRGVKPA